MPALVAFCVASQHLEAELSVWCRLCFSAGQCAGIREQEVSPGVLLIPTTWVVRLGLACVSFTSHFHEFSGLWLRDGNSGLADLDLRLETNGGGSAPAIERLLR